jgi:cell pole-organizing protein PopZ
MSAADAQAEPTMEEILASIRRIISEDDAAPAAPEAPTQDVDDSFDDVLELSEPVAEVPETVSADFDFDALPTEYEAPRPEQTAPEPIFDEIVVEDRWADPPEEAVAEIAPVREAYQPPRTANPESSAFQAHSDYGIVSDPIAAETSHAFAKLAPSNVFPEIFASGNTVEALVIEMLRPMLKEWLDANLPRIVEDKVEAEVARIARRSF